MVPTVNGMLLFLFVIHVALISHRDFLQTPATSPLRGKVNSLMIAREAKGNLNRESNASKEMVFLFRNGHGLN